MEASLELWCATKSKEFPMESYKKFYPNKDEPQTPTGHCRGLL